MSKHPLDILAGVGPVSRQTVRSLLANWERQEYARRVTARMVADSPLALAACQNLASGTEGYGE